jgi:hypothetical protein
MSCGWHCGPETPPGWRPIRRLRTPTRLRGRRVLGRACRVGLGRVLATTVASGSAALIAVYAAFNTFV